MCLFSERISCVIVAGGYKNDPRDPKTLVEVLAGDFVDGNFRRKRLPRLPPNGINGAEMAIHNKAIILCGGWTDWTYSNMCLQLENGNWKEHSILNEGRVSHSVVATNSAIFTFGGFDDTMNNLCERYEYLPKDSKTWLIGKTTIPGGFMNGCAIEVKSGEEIWLIGGAGMADGGKADRIISFNINHHTFQVLPPKLNIERYNLRCAFIPNTKKLMITGGSDVFGGGLRDSTEIIDIEDGTITMGSPMNSKRANHGMGVVTINNEDRLIVFGGKEFFDPTDFSNKTVDTVEVYNTETEKWETTGIKLKNKKAEFGFLTVNLAQIQNL